jgi:DNA-binding beta-propeller fold protein YncE
VRVSDKCAHIQVVVNLCVCMYMYMYIYIHIYIMHAYIQTYTQALCSWVTSTLDLHMQVQCFNETASDGTTESESVVASTSISTFGSQLSGTVNTTAQAMQALPRLQVTRVLKGDCTHIQHTSLFDGIYGIAVNKEGFLLAAVQSDRTVKVFSLEGREGKYIKTLCCDQLTDPRGIALDEDDTLYVADYTEGVVKVFDKKNAHVRDIGKGILSYPLYVTVHDQHVYVIGQNYKVVYIFDTQGTFVRDTGGPSESADVSNKVVLMASNHLCRPTQLAFDGDGKMYVSNYGRFSGVISVFDSHGSFIRKLGHFNPFNPHGLAISSRGVIHVAVTDPLGDSQVVGMDKTGTHIRTISVTGARDICLDTQGKVCVTSSEFHSVATRERRWSIKII